jgi:hypothetical protein
MWRKLFGGVDELPRERIDAVMRIVDSYLFEEAELYGRQSEKQTIHPRELAPDKRRALIEEVLATVLLPNHKHRRTQISCPTLRERCRPIRFGEVLAVVLD